MTITFNTYFTSLESIERNLKQKYPRAYSFWFKEELEFLRTNYKSNRQYVNQTLQRSPLAIERCYLRMG